jgi:ferredoxin
MSGLRVHVDHIVCVGNAMCRAVAPTVFVADADNRSSVADSESASRETILEAASLCPVGAIVVEDAATGEPVDY